MILVFRISQKKKKKMGENGEIVRFLWYFMVFRKRTYGELMGGLGTSLIFFCEIMFHARTVGRLGLWEILVKRIFILCARVKSRWL